MSSIVDFILDDLFRLSLIVQHSKFVKACNFKVGFSKSRWMFCQKNIFLNVIIVVPEEVMEL